MSCNNITPVFDEYVSSFFNAFELKDQNNHCSSVSLPNCANEYVSDYLDCVYVLVKPRIKKSLSWSSTDPSIAFERDSYLMPYACNDYKKYLTQRPRSITLPAKPSSRYLTVDGPTSVNLESFRSITSLSSESLSSPSPLESIQETPGKVAGSAYFSSKEDVGVCDSEVDLLLKNTIENRERSNTAPPNIAVTAEDGLSKYIFGALPLEPVIDQNKKSENFRLHKTLMNTETKNTINPIKDIENSLPSIEDFCWIKSK